MATLPTYARLLMDYAEGFDPSVQRTEMERGPAKQAIVNTHVMKQPKATLVFNTASDAEAFEAWYFDVIKRVGWFDFRHPRTGATIQARFMGGDIGELTPIGPRFSPCQRTVTLEYMR